MLPLLSINWDPNPELFNLFGHIPVRYYGLLWVIGIACSYFVVRYQYRDKKIGDDKFEPLFFYCFFGILIGARLGHCLYSSCPMEVGNGPAMQVSPVMEARWG